MEFDRTEGLKDDICDREVLNPDDVCDREVLNPSECVTLAG